MSSSNTRQSLRALDVGNIAWSVFFNSDLRIRRIIKNDRSIRFLITARPTGLLPVNISTVRPLLRFSEAHHVTICPAAYLRVEDALRMIVFGIGQLIAFAIEDEAGALEFSDHDRRIDAMQCIARFRGRPANGLMIDYTERSARLHALVQLGKEGRHID
jgi:hypothetical protein